MRVDDVEDLCLTALKRPVKREELIGWRPNLVRAGVNHLTGGFYGLGPAVNTLEEVYDLLESGDLPRLHEEYRKREDELLATGWDW